MKESKINNFLNNYKQSAIKVFIDSDDEKTNEDNANKLFNIKEKTSFEKSKDPVISPNEVKAFSCQEENSFSPIISENNTFQNDTIKQKHPVLKKPNKINQIKETIPASNFFEEQDEVEISNIKLQKNGKKEFESILKKTQELLISNESNQEAKIDELKINYNNTYSSILEKQKVFEEIDLDLDKDEETFDSRIIEQELLKKELYNLPEEGKKQLITNIKDFLSKPKVKVIFNRNYSMNLSELIVNITKLSYKENKLNNHSCTIFNKTETFFNEIYIPNSFTDENITNNLMNVSKSLKGIIPFNSDSTFILSLVDNFFSNLLNNKNDTEQLKASMKNNFKINTLNINESKELIKQSYSFEYEPNLFNNIIQSSINSALVNSSELFSIENIIFTGLYGTKNDISLIAEKYYKKHLNNNNKEYYIISMLKAKPFKDFTEINSAYINDNFLDIIRIMLNNFESQSLRDFLANIIIHYEKYGFIPLWLSLLLTNSTFELNDKQIDYLLNLKIKFI